MPGLEFSVESLGVAALAAEMDGWGKELDLSELFALRRVGMMARTQTTRAMASELGVQQKHIRKRIRVFGGNRRNKTARVWGGTRAVLRAKEIGDAKAKKAAPAGASPFAATMPTGHRGVYFRAQPRTRTPRSTRLRRTGPDLPIAESVVNLRPSMNRLLPQKALETHKARFNGLWWRDFRRRVEKKKARQQRRK